MTLIAYHGSRIDAWATVFAKLLVETTPPPATVTQAEINAIVARQIEEGKLRLKTQGVSVFNLNTEAWRKCAEHFSIENTHKAWQDFFSSKTFHIALFRDGPRH